MCTLIEETILIVATHSPPSSVSAELVSLLLHPTTVHASTKNKYSVKGSRFVTVALPGTKELATSTSVPAWLVWKTRYRLMTPLGVAGSDQEMWISEALRGVREGGRTSEGTRYYRKHSQCSYTVKGTQLLVRAGPLNREGSYLASNSINNIIQGALNRGGSSQISTEGTDTGG